MKLLIKIVLGIPDRPKKRSQRLTKHLAVEWPVLMFTLPDAEPMCGIAQPAPRSRRVRSKAMFHKFGLRIFLDSGEMGGPVVSYLNK
jgi:hypothetical protein